MGCNGYSSQSLGTAFACAIGAGLATVLGAAIVLVAPINRPLFLPAALAFSSGVMLYISLIDIYALKAVRHFTAAGAGRASAFLFATLSFFGGVPLGWVLDAVADRLSRDSSSSSIHDAAAAKPTSSSSNNDCASEGAAAVLQQPSCSSSSVLMPPPAAGSTVPREAEAGTSPAAAQVARSPGAAPDGSGCSSRSSSLSCGAACHSDDDIEACQQRVGRGLRNRPSASAVIASPAPPSRSPHQQLAGLTTAPQQPGPMPQPPRVAEPLWIANNRHVEATVPAAVPAPAAPEAVAAAAAAASSAALCCSLMKLGVLAALAVGLHNAPEGLVTFIAYMSSIKSGIATAIAISIHNIPEGIVIAAPILYGSGRRRTAMAWASLSALLEPLGAVIGLAIACSGSLTNAVFGVLFGLVAGIMVFVSVRELLPTARVHDPADRVSTAAFLLGMVVMAGSLIAIGYAR